MIDKNINILLVDDDEDDRDIFQIALEEMETPVYFTGIGNGGEALQMLEDGAVSPDFIFLDLNMPQMSGRECLARLKENSRLARIPVIIFSTSSDSRDIRETIAMGAVDFITKPSKTSELTQILNNFIITQTENSNKK